MAQPSFTSRLRYLSLFIPFRTYFLLFAISIALAVLWLNGHRTGVESSFTALLTLLTKIMLGFGIGILLLSLLTVLVPYIIFTIQKMNKNVSVNIDTALRDIEGTATKQAVKMHISPLMQPIFGFLRYRYVHDGNMLSPKFSMQDTSAKFHFFSKTKEGIYQWPLPEIREYHVERIVVYFEDLFQFFSFSTALKVEDSFFTRPPKKEVEGLNFSPKKTEEENTRIEELRRVDGEYLNYKNFEDNDDVRRIVWKVYAKNKELVVRTQEILDPFASHVYLYASYHDGLHISDNAIIAQKGLNYFKTAIWSVYNRLKQQGFDVRFIPDQEVRPGTNNNEDQKVQYNISLSDWHPNGDLAGYVNTKTASVVCISSLLPAAEVQRTLDVLDRDASVVYIKLSNGLRKQGITKWLRWIFLEEEKDADNRNLMQWNLSGDKRKLHQNEKALDETLKASGLNVVTI